MIIYLNIFFEDYLAGLNISKDLFSNILLAAKVDSWNYLTSKFRQDEKILRTHFLLENQGYIVFKVKDMAENFANYEYQYKFIGVNSFKKLNLLVERYLKLKAFL